MMPTDSAKTYTWCSPIQDQNPQTLMDPPDGVYMISDFAEIRILI